MIAKPLTNLTKKNGFVGSLVAQRAFDILKACMAELPALAIPDFSKEFILEIDAPNQDLGAVLSQRVRWIAFFNQALSLQA